VPVQQFVILSKRPNSANGLASLGPRADLVRSLERFNTSPERQGDDVLYGPGIRLELPPEQGDVSQVLVTITEEEIAWQVIMRLLKEFEWKIVDMNTGRELNA
jgi:hypothetical protein